MSLDGVLLNGLAGELQTVLENGRIDRIYQPETDEIHILIRNNGQNYRLLLSASSSHPRIHLTRQDKTNPLSPPMFCMVLRKHLIGGRLLSISQPGFDRILILHFESLDEMGDWTRKKLIIEIMGRHSNIIFTNQDGKILDSVKHVSKNISRVREVLPGKYYTDPPSHGKSDPRKAGREQVLSLLTSQNHNVRPERILADYFTGISRTTAEEICRMAARESGGQQADCAERIASAFTDFFSKVREGLFQPILVLGEQNKPKDILPFPYGIFPSGQMKSYPSFSDALDDYFITRDRMERIQQRTSHLRKVIRNNMDRCTKKLAMESAEIEKAQDSEVYRLYGELITSNLYRISPGEREVTLENYHDPDGKRVRIPMDPARSPSQNAQAYFKKYNKSRTVVAKQTKFRRETREEITYLESLAEHLSMCSDEADISAIREELIREGYLRRNSGKKKPQRHEVSLPHHYLSSDGYEIFVGKNNMQNDHLTLKTAAGKDLWLHTKVIPGSHVIVKTAGRSVPDTTLQEAANLAAYYSKGRTSANVPVDYCPRKHVKKPGGAKPGMVIYEQYQTMYVTPSEEKVQRMKKL